MRTSTSLSCAHFAPPGTTSARSPRKRPAPCEVIALAAREARILLTEDKDFGWLAFVGSASADGVVLVRYPAGARQAMASSIVDLVATQDAALRGGFTVVQPGQVRIMPGPPRTGQR